MGLEAQRGTVSVQGHTAQAGTGTRGVWGLKDKDFEALEDPAMPFPASILMPVLSPGHWGCGRGWVTPFPPPPGLFCRADSGCSVEKAVALSTLPIKDPQAQPLPHSQGPQLCSGLGSRLLPPFPAPHPAPQGSAFLILLLAGPRWCPLSLLLLPPL